MANQTSQRPVSVTTNVRELRLAAGLSQENAAERFNLSLRVWQTKEAATKPGQLSQMVRNNKVDTLAVKWNKKDDTLNIFTN